MKEFAFIKPVWPICFEGHVIAGNASVILC